MTGTGKQYTKAEFDYYLKKKAASAVNFRP